MTSRFDLETKLQEALGSGEIITVIYHGGHAPGTKRMLMPLSVDNGHLFAKRQTLALLIEIRLHLPKPLVPTMCFGQAYRGPKHSAIQVRQ